MTISLPVQIWTRQGGSEEVKIVHIIGMPSTFLWCHYSLHLETHGHPTDLKYYNDVMYKRQGLRLYDICLQLCQLMMLTLLRNWTYYTNYTIWLLPQCFLSLFKYLWLIHEAVDIFMINLTSLTLFIHMFMVHWNSYNSEPSSVSIIIICALWYFEIW